jgi:putative DNA primase/helicase
MIQLRTEHNFNSMAKGKLAESVDCATEFCLTYDDIIYCLENDSFYRYDSGCYYDFHEVKMHHLLLNTENILDVKNKSRRRRVEIIKEIKNINWFHISDFNQKDLLNLKNCFLDIKNMRRIDHDPKILSTIQLPYEYDEKARCDLWIDTLDRIFEGEEDRVRLLQQYFGYCLTSDTKYEKMMFLIGEAGSGKSTILDGLTYMLGHDNVSALSLKYLGDPRMVGAIVDKYANVVSEIPRNVSDYEDDLKMITSGEFVQVNNKYKDPFKFRPFSKLVFAANKMPKINDTSNAIYRRLLLLYMDAVIPDEEQDKNRKKNLESEASGILNWALEGLKILNDAGSFVMSKEVLNNIIELKKRNNAILQFFEDSIEVTGKEKDVILKDELFKKYNEYCSENHYRSFYSKKNFGIEIQKQFKYKITDTRKRMAYNGPVKQHRAWTGIKYLEDEQDGEEINWEL